MRIFVTGAGGLIGRAFCRAALASGHRVLALSRPQTTREPLPGVDRAIGSLEDVPWPEIERFQADAALHLAWVVTPGIWLTSPENTRLAALSRALFEGLALRGVPRLAAAGSCLEYASTDDPIDETFALSPDTSPYVTGKLAAFHSLQEIAGNHGAQWSWFRIFYAFGAGDHHQRLVPWAMRKLAAGEPVATRTPHEIKDYIPVEDVASALLWTLEKNTGGVANIGSGAGTRILELVRMIARIVGADESLVTPPPPAGTTSHSRTIADIGKLLGTGWTPSLSLEEGLRRMWRDIRQCSESRPAN